GHAAIHCCEVRSCRLSNASKPLVEDWHVIKKTMLCFVCLIFSGCGDGSSSSSHTPHSDRSEDGKDEFKHTTDQELNERYQKDLESDADFWRPPANPNLPAESDPARTARPLSLPPLPSASFSNPLSPSPVRRCACRGPCRPHCASARRESGPNRALECIQASAP